MWLGCSSSSSGGGGKQQQQQQQQAADAASSSSSSKKLRSKTKQVKVSSCDRFEKKSHGKRDSPTPYYRKKNCSHYSIFVVTKNMHPPVKNLKQFEKTPKHDQKGGAHASAAGGCNEISEP